MEQKELGNKTDSVLLINEPDFLLNIYKWNDTTKEFLKAFAERKCNGNEKIDPPVESNVKPLIETITDIKPEIESDTQFILDPKETENDISIEKEKQDSSVAPEKRPSPKQYKIKDAEILGIYGKSKYKIYKPIYENILSKLKDGVFLRNDIANWIVKSYDEIFDEELSYGSALAYYNAYKKYMLDHGIIEEKHEGVFSKIKENNDISKEPEKDYNDLLSKYGEKLEQSRRGSPLQRYILRWALQNNTDVVILSKIIKNPIDGCINNVTKEKLHDGLISLSINGLVTEIRWDEYKINFDKLWVCELMKQDKSLDELCQMHKALEEFRKKRMR